MRSSTDLHPFIDLAAGLGAVVAVGFLVAALLPGPSERRIYSCIWFLTLVVAGVLTVGIWPVGLLALAAGIAVRVWVGTRLRSARRPAARR